MVWSIVTVIVLFLMLLFFCCISVMFFIGGLRQFRRPDRRRQGVALIACTICLTVLFVFLSICLFRVRGSFWLLKPQGLLFLVCLYAVAVFIALVGYSERALQRPSPVSSDYILILGAGLIDGINVTKLLAGRIDKGIEIFRNDGGKPCLVMSGGQGRDERRTEAQAMREYALSKGVPDTHILLEERSTSTKENIRYSKELMDERGTGYSCVFVTNEFHLYRAERAVRKMGLQAEGAPCRTTDYSWPSAFSREYLITIVRFGWVLALSAGAWSILFKLLA